MSIGVSNLQRSVDSIGMSLACRFRARRAAELVQLKPARVISIRRGDGPKGVDHIAIGLDCFNKTP